MNGLASAEVKEVRCMRPGCHRKLTSARSVAEGYGPVCARKIREAAKAEIAKDFTTEQQDKAAQLIADKGIVPAGRPGVYRAVSSSGDESYLVTANACLCAGGRRAKRPCYHQFDARILNLASAPVSAITQTRRAPIALAAA
jgi:Family of unknown function (DUF6011)